MLSSLSASVIIPTWDGCDYIEVCLAAVLAQDVTSFEVIVVDNASTDGTADLVAEKFPVVRLIRNTHNLGFAGGCNIGLRVAQGEMLVLLNQDTIVAPNWLQALSDALQQEKIGVAGCKIFYPDGKTIQHAGAWIEWPLGLAHHYGQGERDTGLWDTPRGVECVTGAAMAFRQEVLERVGLMDEAFWPGYFEDMDFCFRVREAGYEIWYIPQATLSHAETTSITDKLRLAEVYQRGRLRFLLKHTLPDRFLSEFVPAEEAYQFPAILGDDSRALRLAYLEAITQAATILCQRWQANWDTINDVIKALRHLHHLAWVNDWRKVEQAVTGVPATSISDNQIFKEGLPELQEIHFESKIPVVGSLIARFRSLWYSVAAQWAVRYLRQQQALINQQQYGYISALERRLMELVEDKALLAQEIATLRLQIQDNVERGNK